MPQPLMSVSIQAGYGSRKILKHVRFDLYPGETLGLAGTSGAGKSTLVMALMGLLPWAGGNVTGHVLLEGQDLLRMQERDLRQLRGRRLALVPQSPMSALNAAVSLRAHFEEAWRAHNPTGRRALEQRLQALMPEVQLPSSPDFLAHRPAQISVGQAQRILIALALLHRPAVLIADEPTSALDPVTQREIISLLSRLSRQAGTTLLYISHDLVSVLQLCDRLAVLDSGTIQECLPITKLQHAQHPATLSLLGTLPAPAHILVNYRNEVTA